MKGPIMQTESSKERAGGKDRAIVFASDLGLVLIIPAGDVQKMLVNAREGMIYLPIRKKALPTLISAWRRVMEKPKRGARR